MKSNKFLVSVLFVVMAAGMVMSQLPKCNPKEHSCPKNEVYICSGSPCQTTCKAFGCKCNIQTFVPVNGCYCIKGYARNKKGKCVDAYDCNCQEEQEKCP